MIEMPCVICYNGYPSRSKLFSNQAESRKFVPPSRHHPHDKLFRTVLADQEEAEGLLRAYLPETVSTQLDWSTLTLVETSFVDEALRDSESDVLYKIQRLATG